MAKYDRADQIIEFEPPHELAVLFGSWRDAIGPSAYRSFMRGAEAWRGTDGAIHIRAQSQFRASWIRKNYVGCLEAKAQQPVIVSWRDP